MLRLPSEFTHVRPLTFSVTSVPADWIRSSRAPCRRSMSVAWNARSSPHERSGSGWSRNSARSTKASKSARLMPACWAPACVGQSVEHQRLLHRQLAQRLARAGGAGEALGIDAGERAGVLGRLDAELRVRLLRLGVRRPRRTSRDGGRARGGSARPSRRGARRARAATRRARGSRAGTRAAAARRASSSARAPPGRAGRRGSSPRGGRRSGAGVEAHARVARLTRASPRRARRAARRGRLRAARRAP